MPDAFFVKPTVPAVHAALIAGFDGLVLSDGSVLRASYKPDDIDKVADNLLPYLLFEPGNLQFSPWQDFTDYLSWDMTAQLKITGTAGELDLVTASAIQDILARTKALVGLPINSLQQVVPFTDQTASLFDAGQLQFLAERGAPFLKTIQVQPAVGAYQRTAMVFHLETTLSLDPRGPMSTVRQVSIGILPVAPGKVIQDPFVPDGKGWAVLQNTDRVSFGPLTSPGPAPTDTSLPQRSGQPIKTLKGTDFKDQIRQVTVSPYSAAVSAGTPTAQLSAIATFANWSTQYCTLTGAWSSDTPSVATVNASGLVTRVAAGTANITCTFAGAISNACVITAT